jgi:hypothetical protein
MLRGTFTAGVFTAALIASVGAPAQQCQSDAPESVDISSAFGVRAGLGAARGRYHSESRHCGGCSHALEDL